jgi:hypothetical protein
MLNELGVYSFFFRSTIVDSEKEETDFIPRSYLTIVEMEIDCGSLINALANEGFSCLTQSDLEEKFSSVNGYVEMIN